MDSWPRALASAPDSPTKPSKPSEIRRRRNGARPPGSPANARPDLRALPGWRAPTRLLREHLLPSADYMRIKYAGVDHPLPVLYLRRILNRLFRPKR